MLWGHIRFLKVLFHFICMSGSIITIAMLILKYIKLLGFTRLGTLMVNQLSTTQSFFFSIPKRSLHIWNIGGGGGVKFPHPSLSVPCSLLPSLPRIHPIPHLQCRSRLRRPISQEIAVPSEPRCSWQIMSLFMVAPS